MELVGRPIRVAARLEAGVHLLPRHVVGRLVLAVVDAAGDDRAVRVALEELDDHLLANARDVDRAPLLAGKGVGHAHEAGVLVAARAVTVPVELQLHPAQGVGVDLLTLGPDDGGRLWPGDRGQWGQPRGAELRIRRDHGEAALEHRAAAATGGRQVVVGCKTVRDDQVVLVQGRHRMIAELELVADLHAALGARTSADLVAAMLLFHADLGVGLPRCRVGVLARVVVQLEARVLVAALLRRGLQQGGVGLVVVIVVNGVGA